MADESLLELQKQALEFAKLIEARWTGADRQLGVLYFAYGYPEQSLMPIEIVKKLLAMQRQIAEYKDRLGFLRNEMRETDWQNLINYAYPEAATWFDDDGYAL
jgi:hypothetical protein